MPQYIPPHLHANPVSPTFFLHEAQRFFFTFFGSSGSSDGGSETAGADSRRTDFAAAPSSKTSALSTTEVTTSETSSTLTFKLEREAVVAATSSGCTVELCSCSSFFRKSL